ncbi:hypothetical protein [Streptomyces sp. NPDC057748]|uniref:hypothetical protein n=1 Tax=unclassified Streptomyces TaxID=2593676 RepID=UPI0036B34887
MSASSNLLPANTSGIETDTSGWTAGANTTLSKSTRFYTGAASLGMTATAAGSVTATTAARVAVVAGTEYTAYGYFANITATAGRTATVRVDWYAAVSGGTAISSVTSAGATLPAATAWNTPPPILIGMAPSGATYAAVTLTVTGLAAGGAVAADAITLGPTNLISGNVLPYALQGFEIGAGGWTAYSNCTIAPSSAVTAYEGWYTLLVTSTAVGMTVTGTTDTVPATVGAEYVGTYWVRPTVDGECRLLLKWYDAGGALLGSTQTETWTVAAGAWSRCTIIRTAPVGAVSMRLQPAPVATAVGQTWHIDQVALRVAPTVPGGMLSYDAQSMEVSVSAWAAVSGCTISRSTDYAYEGAASLRVDPLPANAMDATIQLVSRVLVSPRQAYQLTPRVRLGASTQHRYMTAKFSWYSVENTLLRSISLRWTLAPSGGGWYSPPSSAVAPAGAATLGVSIRIESAEPNEIAYVDAVALVPGGLAVLADPIAGRFGASISMQGLTSDGFAYWGLWRTNAGGSMTPVRGSSGDLTQVAITGDVAVVEDYEAPLGVDVSYYLKLWTTPASYRATGSDPIVIPEPHPTEVVLKDPGLPARQTTAVVAAGGQPTWTRKARQGVNPVRGRVRPIVISDVRTSREGTMTLITETAQDLADMWWLLETGNVLLIQWPALFGERDVYVSVGDVAEAPVVNYAEYRDRTWTVPLTEVDRPIGAAIGSAGRTWQTVNDGHPDWLDVLTSATSWLDVYTGVNGG